METLKVLNKRLEEVYGRIEDQVRFKIVFSDTEFEKRFEEGLLHYGQIYVGEETRLGIFPKYYYIKGKHVLEELFFGHFPDKPWLKCNYEPIWTFQDKDGNSLYPIWPAVRHVVECKLHGVTRAMRDLAKEEKEEFDAEVKEIAEALGIDGDGVHDMKGQSHTFVKPVFLNVKIEGDK